MKIERHFYKYLAAVIITCNSMLVAASNTYTSDNIHINIIYPSNSHYHTQTAKSAKEHLGELGIAASITSHENYSETQTSKSSAYIVIGKSVISRSLRENLNAPLLLIANSANSANTDVNPSISHLVLAQQKCREIAFIKALKQDWKSIGILSSIFSVNKATELTKCAIQYGFNLSIYTISDEKDLPRTLENAVENNDTILAIADPLIYNRNTIKNILLTAYRNRCPIIGYSKSFVNAGAIAGIYTSPNTAGEYAATIIYELILNDWKFRQRIYYPMDFTIKTNRRVTKSLDINLPNIETIKQTILDGEEK